MSDIILIPLSCYGGGINFLGGLNVGHTISAVASGMAQRNK